jgi:hypothetical protein
LAAKIRGGAEIWGISGKELEIEPWERLRVEPELRGLSRVEKEAGPNLECRRDAQ